MRMPHVPRAGEDDGFSLIEVIVSLVIMVMVAGFVAAGLITVAKMDKANRERAVAADLVDQQLNAARVGINSLGYGTSDLSPAPVVNGTTYTITTIVEPVALGAAGSPCDGGSATGSTMTVERVTVIGTWTNMKGVKPVRADTQVAPKSPISSTSYSLGFKVTNALNQPVVDQNVTLAPGSASTHTDTEGCAFFTGLTSGSYTGTISVSNWVDQSLKSSASVVVGTSAGQTAVGQLVYDNSATLNLTMPGNSVYVMPATMPLTLTASGLKSGGSPYVASCYGTAICGTFPGTSSTSRTVGGLFPFGSGYTGWIGDCAGANLSPNSYPVSSGMPSNVVNATGGAVKLIATKSGAVPSQTVTLSQAPGTTGCPTAESYIIGTTNTGNSNTVYTWMPYGTWTVTMKNTSTGVATTGTVTVNASSTIATPATLTLSVS
jgi:prepilin-type N-terminal cleavage/methylation domain-containing protein